MLAVIGDGAAMYGIQGLWTAAHYNLPVTFVVTNNRQYKILKDCAKVLGLPEACADRFESLDLDEPPIDYVGMAAALGVSGCRVEEPEELSDTVRQSLAGDRPQLIEVAVRHPQA